MMSSFTKQILNEEFEKLKSQFQQPKLSLNSYFSAIRDEIDIAFAQKRINETEEFFKGGTSLHLFLKKTARSYIQHRNS